MTFLTKDELDKIKKEHDSELPKYCDDFCPIAYSIRKYNRLHPHNIYCSTEMCEKIMDAYILNRNEDEPEWLKLKSEL